MQLCTPCDRAFSRSCRQCRSTSIDLVFLPKLHLKLPQLFYTQLLSWKPEEIWWARHVISCGMIRKVQLTSLSKKLPLIFLRKANWHTYTQSIAAVAQAAVSAGGNGPLWSTCHETGVPQTRFKRGTLPSRTNAGAQNPPQHQPQPQKSGM